ncbi:MAG: hypothetical protein PHT62_01220 [Desulfotomaculaceae bacterium]|nr:hypothetical protein [Desulfotomaculaceae bacterium]
MNWQGLKIPIIIVSLLAGMALFFAGQWLYQKYSFNEPLNDALKSNPSIESFSVSDKGRVLQVDVSLKYDADMMMSYKELIKELTNAMGKKNFQLILGDSRDIDDVLGQVWYKAQYAVYEASFQGNFQDMATVVNREASTSGVVAIINVDQENIYLRLKHEGHTLDQVITLNVNQNNGIGQAPATGGGNNDQGN